MLLQRSWGATIETSTLCMSVHSVLSQCGCRVFVHLNMGRESSQIRCQTGGHFYRWCLSSSLGSFMLKSHSSSSYKYACSPIMPVNKASSDQRLMTRVHETNLDLSNYSKYQNQNNNWQKWSKFQILSDPHLIISHPFSTNELCHWLTLRPAVCSHCWTASLSSHSLLPS